MDVVIVGLVICGMGLIWVDRILNSKPDDCKHCCLFCKYKSVCKKDRGQQVK